MSRLQAIRALIRRHAGPGQLAIAADTMPGLTLVASSVPTEPICHVYEPVLGLDAQGAKSIVMGERHLQYAEGEFLVVTADLPITSYIASATERRPFLSLGLKLDSAKIASLLLDAPPQKISRSPGTALSVSKAPNELLEAIRRLLRLLNQKEDLPIIGPLVEREILWRLLRGEQGDMIRQMRREWML
jgi:AraC-type transcriptional regulator N-terminus